MIGRIELPSPGSEEIGGIVLGTVRGAGHATGPDRELVLDVLGRTIELGPGSARAGETHAFRIGEEAGRVFLEPVPAEGGDAIDAALRHLGRLPDPRGRAIVLALLGEGLAVTAPSLAALDRAVAIARAEPELSARAGALLLAAGIEITPRTLAAALLLLGPWPEVSERIRAAAARLGEDLLFGSAREEALGAIARTIEGGLVRGELPEEALRAARDGIAFLDASGISASHLLFALPAEGGFALVRIRFEDRRRPARGRAPTRFVIDLALSGRGRVWGEVVVEGRAGRARFRAESPRMRRALAKALPELLARLAERGIAVAGDVEKDAPPARGPADGPARRVAGLDVEA